MFIAFLFVLSAAAVGSQSVEQDGLRKSRQLDLGLQDIQIDDEQTLTTNLPNSALKNDLNNDYLPPAPTSLTPEFTSAQSQQSFNFKSANSVEKENELCKPPYDNESCNVKGSSDSKIPEPSRDLVPPFNDLEQEIALKSTPSEQQTNEAIKTTIEDQSKFSVTTEKLNTKTIKPLPSQKPSTIATTIKPSPEVRKAEATNELRSYLPPSNEYSAAAQTNVAVLQPARQSHDHNHEHGHHHGENFNICTDAFHSFLCAPLKARKRITGAFPSSLLGQSSFINYQKTLLSSDKETAPSNAFRNEYLPPNSASTNLVQSTYIPPFSSRKLTISTTTTLRPFTRGKIIYKPSNSKEKFYLPPISNNQILNSPKPAPSSESFSSVRPSAVVTPVAAHTASLNVSSSLLEKVPAVPSASKSVLPTIPTFTSFFSEENKAYLPPKPNPQPSSSFLSTSNVSPISSTFSPLSSTFVMSTGLSPQNSIFISQKPVIQPMLPVFTSTLQPFSSVSTVATTPKLYIRVPSFASQPSKPSGSYLPPASKPQFSFTPSPTTIKPYSSTFKYTEQPSNPEKSYLPPDVKEPAAAQISSAAVAAPQVKNPFHHGRDLCTDPFHSFLCSSSKPRKRITGQLPSGSKSESSNTNESRLKPEPSSPEENKIRPEKPLETAPAQNLGYKYPRPVNPLPTPSNTLVSSTPLPTTGYSYPKPDKIFPLSSQQDIKLAPVSSTTKKSETVYRTSEAKVVSGYQYPKPNKIFPLPSGPDSTKEITTTGSPTTGYSYPKPQKPFPLPSEQKEVRQELKQKTSTSLQSSTSLPTNQVRGYQYPKPQQSLNLPEKKGYSYPKPEKRLELPTESRSKLSLPQSSSNLDPLGNLGSADFIPVNKIEYKRAESSKLLTGLRNFGERMKIRQRQSQLLKRQPH